MASKYATFRYDTYSNRVLLYGCVYAKEYRCGLNTQYCTTSTIGNTGNTGSARQLGYGLEIEKQNSICKPMNKRDAAVTVQYSACVCACAMALIYRSFASRTYLYLLSLVCSTFKQSMVWYALLSSKGQVCDHHLDVQHF